MMALRQETVRLLISDDVGIGKTVEFHFIARELHDRGEISGFTVSVARHIWRNNGAMHFRNNLATMM